MKHRCFVTTCVLLLFLFSATPIFAKTLYADVNEKTENYAEIQFLVDRSIIKANTTESFNGTNVIRRGQFAVMLSKALKLPLPKKPSTSRFSDVTLDDPNYRFYDALTQAQLMSDDANGAFLPNKIISRAQAAQILSKAFQLKGTVALSFTDVPNKHSAYFAISKMVANRYMNGVTKTQFKPDQAMTKAAFSTLLAHLLSPILHERALQPKTCVQQSKQPIYRIDVAVANFWKQPHKGRAVDRPSLIKPVDYTKWIGSMSLAQKKWLVGQTDTQALYGDEVKYIKSNGTMSYVAAVDQYVPYNANGYPGWVPSTQIVKTMDDTSRCEIAVVTSKKATLYNESNKQPFLQVSYSTILPVIKQENGYYYVQTPANGVKLLKTNQSKKYSSYKAIPKPSTAAIVSTAKSYIGLPYIWSGISSWGFDCSGIIYAAYRAHGILIPRDSFYQATKGASVAKKNLRQGDLVFFAYNGGTGKVYHVGLYIGNGQMLHAPNYASKVRIDYLNSGVYLHNYAGAKRYIQ